MRLRREPLANRRLADEYDAAQGRGEIDRQGADGKVRSDEIGLAPKEIHEARKLRDAEVRETGIINLTLDEKLAAGKEARKGMDFLTQIRR
jgi:hypothetical protein